MTDQDGILEVKTPVEFLRVICQTFTSASSRTPLTYPSTASLTVLYLAELFRSALVKQPVCIARMNPARRARLQIELPNR
jgi:hypothetical protein